MTQPTKTLSQSIHIKNRLAIRFTHHEQNALTDTTLRRQASCGIAFRKAQLLRLFIERYHDSICQAGALIGLLTRRSLK